MWCHQRWGWFYWRCNRVRDFTRSLSCIIYHKNSGEFIKMFVKTYTNTMPCHWQNIVWEHTYCGNYRYYTTNRYIRINRKDNMIHHIPNIICLYINVNFVIVLQVFRVGVSIYVNFIFIVFYFSVVSKFVD